MTAHSRTMAAIVFAGAAMTSLLLAQGPPPAPQGQAPAGQPPAEQGRGDPGRGAGPGAGRQGGRGGRAGGFTQFTRQLAPQDVIVRGKSLYEANCTSCHAADLRGTPTGANLLRSGIALSDQHGEKVGPSLKTHSPAITLADSRQRCHRRVHPQRSRQHERPGQPAGTQSHRDRAQRPGRRPQGRRNLFRGGVLQVPFRERRSQGDRRKVHRRRGRCRTRGCRGRAPHSAGLAAAVAGPRAPATRPR